MFGTMGIKFINLYDAIGSDLLSRPKPSPHSPTSAPLSVLCSGTVRIQQEEDLPWSAARTQGAREREKKLLCLEHSVFFSCLLFSFSFHFLWTHNGSMESGIQIHTVPSFVLISSLRNKARNPNLTYRAVFCTLGFALVLNTHQPSPLHPVESHSRGEGIPTLLSTSCPGRGKIT